MIVVCVGYTSRYTSKKKLYVGIEINELCCEIQTLALISYANYFCMSWLKYCLTLKRRMFLTY